MATGDDTETNTHYLGKFVGNGGSAEEYEDMLAVAERGDVDEFRKFITDLLRNAPVDTPAYYTSRELSDEDLAERMDWPEVMSYLVDPEEGE